MSERSAVIRFRPGLLPVLKKMTRSQAGRYAANARWAGHQSVTALSGSIVDRVRANGGLTVSMVDGFSPAKGYMVAKGEGYGAVVSADRFFDPVQGPRVLAGFLKTHRMHLTGGSYLGLWHNERDGQVYLDVADNVPNKRTAVRQGKATNQISIWDIVKEQEIPTGGTGEITKGAGHEGATDSGDTGARPQRHDRRGDRPVRAGVVGEGGFQHALDLLLKMTRSEAGRFAANVRWGNHPSAIPDGLKAMFDYAVGRKREFATDDEKDIAMKRLGLAARKYARQNGIPTFDRPHDEMSSADIFATGMQRRALDVIDQDERWGERSDEDAQRVQESFDEWRSGGHVMVNVPVDYLDAILADGVKNQFQTGDSLGLYEPDLRAAVEHATHNVAPNAPAEDRPVYGFVSRDGLERPRSLEGYGEVTLVLKDEVRSRSTVTLGDSLNTAATPVYLDRAASPRDVSDASARSIFNNEWQIVANTGTQALAAGAVYMEAQIFGGVKREDIARIVFSDVIDLEGSGIHDLREELAGTGIKVEVYGQPNT